MAVLLTIGASTHVPGVARGWQDPPTGDAVLGASLRGVYRAIKREDLDQYEGRTWSSCADEL
jgi:hypothetical protein